MNLDGKWKVVGKTGILRFFVGDVKHIKGARGYNRLLGVPWGRFKITYESGRIILTYEKGGIVDKLKVVNKDKLSGIFLKHDNFVGYFTMKRIK